MKALRALRTLTPLSSKLPYTHSTPTFFLCRFYAAQSQPDIPPDNPPADTAASAALEQEYNDDGCAVFDSAQYPSIDVLSDDSQVPAQPAWDESYRAKVDRTIFGEEDQKLQKKRKKKERNAVEDELKRHQAALLAKTLLQASLQRPDHADDMVKEEHQKSLSVGVIGAPNAGKSCLTNYMVGTKVAAVSRKTNTTTHEVLGVLTKGDTQICFFDTPGLILRKNGYPSNDMKLRVESAWNSISLYDVLIVIFDAERHLNRPDSRVVRLIDSMGKKVRPDQKRVLCMNKIDLVKKKTDLLKIREEFKDLPGYDRFYMISGLKGAGVKDLTQYLMEQAVKRPWDEDPFVLTEDVMKNISLEVVREKLLDHIHQEIPYNIEHHLMGWKELLDGSLRIEHHLITHKVSQRGILLGKKGSKIGRIGSEATAELRSLLKRDVRLFLEVKLKR